MVGDAAARRCPERDINTRLPVAIEGFVLIFSGNLAEIRWLGPGAWHPLDPSWVPLPVPGAGKIYWGHGVRGLASPDPLVGVTQHVAGCTWCGRCTRWHASLVTVQFLDKVVAVPVVVATGAVTRQGR